MLRSWLEYQEVYLAPGRARLARVHRLRPTRAAVTEVEVPTEAPLADLDAVLGEPRLPVRLSLSGLQAHALVIPWQPSLTGAAEWEAYGRHTCISTFGERVADWRIAVSRQGYGQPVMLAAVDEALYAHVSTELRKQGRRLLAVEPYGAQILNRHRRALGRDFWLFIAEQDTCTVWYARDGAIRNVLAQPLETDWRASLQAVIAREIAKKGDPAPPPVFVHAWEGFEATNEAIPGVRLHALQEVMP